MGSELSQFVAALAVVASGGMATVLLLNFYAQDRVNRRLGAVQLWASRWDFTPGELGGFRWRKLALVSFFCLFLEMLMIRWVSAEVPVFAYFKNFILIACFLGFGLGCYFCRRSINLFALLLPLLLLTVLIKLPWPALRQVVQQLPYYFGPTSDTYLWGARSVSLTPGELTVFAAALALVIPFFALVVFLFIPVGQMVGWYLEQATDGVWGYTVNVAASLAGIGLYTLLCFLFQPPAVWFGFSSLILVGLLWSSARLRWSAALACLACIGLTALGSSRTHQVLWSPYQKVTLMPHPDPDHPVSYELQTNDSWHQEIFDLSPEFVSAHPQLFADVPAEWNAYNIPYHFYPQPPSVLVLGAGTGNDVAAALRNGARNVTAVEIDPLILKLGRELHFEKPYASPRVQVVLDDARSYIQDSHDQFDVIVFSLLDSHTTSSHFSNIRIDNYVYTQEALQAARRLLRPDGVFIVKFWVATPWIAGRLYDLVAKAFGQSPLDLAAMQSGYTTSGRFFIVGSQQRIHQALADPGLRKYLQDISSFRTEKVRATTDDWPYLYQRKPGLPLNVMFMSVLLIILCWVFLQRTGTRLGSFRWHFFFLGSGFMLLETQIVSKMALLFGTTWLVNSFVVGGLLLLIVLANLLVKFAPRIPFAVAYAGIFLSLVFSYFTPLEKFFFESIWLKALSATLVLCLPVFFAGIVFIRSFTAAGFQGQALGSNLFGALVGGLLESLSFWTGIRSLLVVAACLYAASWLVLRRQVGQPSQLPAVLAGRAAN